MKLGGVIHEYPRLVHSVHAVDDAVCFAEGDRVRSFSPAHGDRIVTSRSELRAMLVSAGVIWLEHDERPEDKSSFVCEAVSLANGKVQRRSAHPLAEAELVEGFAAFLFHHDGGPIRLRTVNVGEDSVRGELAVKMSALAADAAGVCGLGTRGLLWGADWDAAQAWSRDFETTLGDFGTCRPQAHEELVIAPMGLMKGDRSRSLVVAVRRDTGRTVWQRECAVPFGSLRVDDGVVLIIAGARIVRLDAATGDVLTDVPSGFATDGVAQSLQRIGERLVAVAPREGRIRLFSGEANELEQELRLPAEYRPHDHVLLTAASDRYYLPCRAVTMNPVSNGLLELGWDLGGEAGEIQVPPWPVESTVLRIGTKTGNEEYLHIAVSDGDLEDVLRYGRIALQSRLNAECEHRWSSAQGSKFNGRILFSCQVAETRSGEAKVLAMLSRVNDWAAVHDMTAPLDGETPARIELAKMSEFRRMLPKG
jgi:hypothetical protein